MTPRTKRRFSIFIFISVTFAGIIYHLFYLSNPPSVMPGSSPLEIVQTFYHSINRMDFQTMNQITTQGAGKAEIDEVAQMRAVSKIRRAYSPESPFISADQWIQEGQPEIPPNQRIYGIANLKIEEVPQSPQPVFWVSYEKWMPRGDLPKGPASPIVRHQMSYRLDKVSLMQKGEQWTIYQIERSSESRKATSQ